MNKVTSNPPEQPCVAILLCTYNGELFLTEQLDSIIRQTHKNWVVYASDDGSKDRTIEILYRYQAELGEQKFRILNGPQQGFSKNFMSLIKNKSIEADYYAFSDQDDIWHENKIEIAIEHLKSFVNKAPSIYCSRTHLIDTSGNSLGYSSLFRKTPSFSNALVESIAGANTMIIDNQARNILATTPNNAKIISHDWLAYILVSSCDGNIFYDQIPRIDYRQHSANVIGSNTRFKDKIKRLKKILKGTFRDWNESNIHILESCKEIMSETSKQKLAAYQKARKANSIRRIIFLRKAKLYRQTLTGEIGLYLAAALGKI
ncbi:glycosyltransferase family 2 protein [Pseudomonas sp.]|uniref:glycosyltransferase family 2 protein n=1 Tax=Pseudomonas sp. TaxID=306 RepID=UPI0028A5F907|nr:glycosyltransferase family 2 protein [Pseudomonas sp.]